MGKHSCFTPLLPALVWSEVLRENKELKFNLSVFDRDAATRDDLMFREIITIPSVGRMTEKVKLVSHKGKGPDGNIEIVLLVVSDDVRYNMSEVTATGHNATQSSAQINIDSLPLLNIESADSHIYGKYAERANNGTLSSSQVSRSPARTSERPGPGRRRRSKSPKK